jgi:hypothetical protein
MSRILLLIFYVSTALSVPAIWLRNQVTDTERYTRTVAPLAADPAIQAALCDRVTTVISARLADIVERDGLIERDFLRAPLVSLLGDYVDKTVRTLVASEQFKTIWERINRAAHPAVSALLTGRETTSISTANGQIMLNLAPLLNETVTRLRERGVSIVDRIPLDQLDTTFVLYQSQDLADAQGSVRRLGNLATWLPALALISLVASLVFSTDRRQTVFWGGLGLAVAMAACLMLLGFARWWSVNHLPTGVNRAAATAFFLTIGRYPRHAFVGLSLLGVFVAAGSYLSRYSFRPRAT